MKKLIAIILIAALALTAVFANGSQEGDGAKLDKVRVAYMTNYASLWSVAAAINSGSFAEQGIEVELVEFADGPTIIAAMESGSIDIGYIGPGAHKLCINGRADIFLFSQVGNADCVIGLSSHGVTSDPASLKGKKIGYASGTSSEMILRWTLEEAGLSFDDITAFEMDAAAITSAMTSGALDACATWSPSSFTILNNVGSDGFIISDNVRYSDRAASVASWIVMSNYAEKNHDLLIRYTKGLLGGIDYAVANQEEDIQWVADILGVSYDNVYSQRGDADWPTSAKILSMIESGELESLYEVQKVGFGDAVDVNTPVSDYVLFDVMLEALK